MNAPLASTTSSSSSTNIDGLNIVDDPATLRHLNGHPATDRKSSIVDIEGGWQACMRQQGLETCHLELVFLMMICCTCGFVIFGCCSFIRGSGEKKKKYDAGLFRI